MTDDTLVRDAAAIAAVDDLSTYKWGFVSPIESEMAPKGLSEDTVRYISAKKDEPQWLLDWRLKAYRLWLTMEAPDWAKVEIAPIDYQDMYFYAAPKAKPTLASLDELDPEILRTYEKLGIPIEEQKMLAGVEGSRRVAVDRGVRQRLGRHHFPRRAGARRRHLPLDQRGGEGISGPGPQVARLGSTATRQLFRLPELGGLQRRHLRLHPRRRPLPDGAVDLFPHQCPEHRPVRAHADRRR